MKSFLFDIGSRGRKTGRLVGLVRDQLLKSLSEEKLKSGITQQALARKLGVNRSLINRQLSGEANLTLRTLADLAWALDREVSVELRQADHRPGQNISSDTSTIDNGQVRYVSLRIPGKSSGPVDAVK